jgi:hypothetical protein
MSGFAGATIGYNDALQKASCRLVLLMRANYRYKRSAGNATS